MAPGTALYNLGLYTIGWISALPIERAAATATADDHHAKLTGFIQHEVDKNSSTWGRIGSTTW